MNTDFPHVPWLPRDHNEKRATIPPEEIARYRGQYVAYSWDGSQIVAGAPSEEALVQQLIDAGIDTQRVVFSYVDER